MRGGEGKQMPHHQVPTGAYLHLAGGLEPLKQGLVKRRLTTESSQDGKSECRADHTPVASSPLSLPPPAPPLPSPRSYVGLVQLDNV